MQSEKYQTAHQNPWVQIYSTNSHIHAALVSSYLLEHEIPCVPVNYIDSAYGVWGSIQLYTHRDWVLKAIHLLDKYE